MWIRKSMTRLTRKRRMRTMDDEHNNNDDNNETTIKRKRGCRTRMRDEETTRKWDEDEDNEQ